MVVIEPKLVRLPKFPLAACACHCCWNGEVPASKELIVFPPVKLVSAALYATGGLVRPWSASGVKSNAL